MMRVLRDHRAAVLQTAALCARPRLLAGMTRSARFSARERQSRTYHPRNIASCIGGTGKAFSGLATIEFSVESLHLNRIFHLNRNLKFEFHLNYP